MIEHRIEVVRAAAGGWAVCYGGKAYAFPTRAAAITAATTAAQELERGGLKVAVRFDAAAGPDTSIIGEQAPV